MGVQCSSTQARLSRDARFDGRFLSKHCYVWIILRHDYDK